MSSLSLNQERLEHPLSPGYSAKASPSPPCHAGSPITDFEGSLVEKQARHGTGKEFAKGGRSRVTIDVLPDVALLEIFEFYVYEAWEEEWQTLVQVCRKWRYIVLGSPRRLNLRLYCRARTPVREKLDVWPLLPIAILGYDHQTWGMDNIVTALDHNDRVCDITIWGVPSSQVEKVLAAMQQSFPMLTKLVLQFEYATEPAVRTIPDSFLGGSAPSLQSLLLYRVPFPGLSKVLSSATNLVVLSLSEIPHSGYIPPEALVPCLSVLTRLNQLEIGFGSPLYHPDRKTPPQIRSLLPVLTTLWFEGASEYLEDLLARIDAPLLDHLNTSFHQLIFDTAQLTQFISRAPKFQTHIEAYLAFSSHNASVRLQSTFGGWFLLKISCRQPNLQLSSLAQACNSSVSQVLTSTVERLFIENGLSRPQWQDDIENSQWLELLRPFAAVKDLYISEEFMSRIAPALQELVGERVTEVLPTVQNLFLEETLLSGPVQEAIGGFVAARQLASHPIAISLWERAREREMDDQNELVEYLEVDD